MLKDGELSPHAQNERRGRDFGMSLSLSLSLGVRCGCVGFGQNCKRSRDDPQAFSLHFKRTRNELEELSMLFGYLS